MNFENLIHAPISRACMFSVVIPVRDEAGHLAQTLDAFAAQVDLHNRPVNPNIYEIILLANNCRDESARRARDWQRRNPRVKLHVAEISLPRKYANVGFVRQLLMNEAYRRLRSNRSGSGIIATTDGDTRVASDWLAATIEEIERGADAVGGRILIADQELKRMDEQARYFHLQDEEYRLLVSELECHLDRLAHDVRPRHHQHFNGSFAVTTEAYRRAGGIPSVRFLEDVAFYHALLRIDAKFRHSPAVKVFTSARHLGRSPVGLSFQLNEWKKLGEAGADYLVESAEAIEKKLSARKILRRLWLTAKEDEQPKPEIVSALAETLCVPSEFILSELVKPQAFGSLLEKIYARQTKSRKWHRCNPPIAVETAIAELRIKLASLRSPQTQLFKTKAG